jgi:hypothetical protein
VEDYYDQPIGLDAVTSTLNVVPTVKWKNPTDRLIGPSQPLAGSRGGQRGRKRKCANTLTPQSAVLSAAHAGKMGTCFWARVAIRKHHGLLSLNDLS